MRICLKCGEFNCICVKLAEVSDSLREPTAWIPWSGGECPVMPEESVFYTMRWSSEVRGPTEAHRLNWNHYDNWYDIIFYRVETNDTQIDHTCESGSSLASVEIKALKEKIAFLEEHHKREIIFFKELYAQFVAEANGLRAEIDRLRSKSPAPPLEAKRPAPNFAAGPMNIGIRSSFR